MTDNQKDFWWAVAEIIVILILLLIACGCRSVAHPVGIPLTAERAFFPNGNITSLQVTPDQPPNSFSVIDPHPWFITNIVCWTASVGYSVGSGAWNLEWNYTPTGVTQTHSGWSGMTWVKISPTLFGPASGVMVLAIPPEPSGFFRLTPQ